VARISREQLLHRLETEIADVRQRLGGLPRAEEAAEIWQHIWLEETHNSTAIEGNTLVMREVRILLEEGKAVGSKALEEYLEVQAYGTAAKWVYDQAISAGQSQSLARLREIRHIHSLTVKPVWDIFTRPGGGRPGDWRSVDIAQFQSGMKPPEHCQVTALMSDFASKLSTGPPHNVSPLGWIAKRHCEFQRIHPFEDGNGRAGRLLTNLVLVRLGYPPVIVYKRDRRRYLEALAKDDRGDHWPLTELFTRAAKANLDRFVYPSIAGTARLVPLSALANKAITIEALRQAASRGRLKYIKQRGDLFSSKAWVHSYLREKRRPGRPPRAR